MARTVAVLQSNYIPWKGYFDIIHDVDEFVFYDDVQYTKNDWRNRNKLKTPGGTEWITIPCGTNLRRRICDVRLPDPVWQREHWRKIQQHYSAAPSFDRFRPFFEAFYLGQEWESLSAMNQHLIERISRDMLGITTLFSDSRRYEPAGTRQDRLLDLLRKAGATSYVTGPSASYIEPSRFEEAGIALVWKDYAGYPEYPQFHPPFVHGVSILDLLFQVGSDAPRYIWGWRKGG